VKDEVPIRETMAAMPRKKGLSVFTAEYGSEVLELFESQRAQIVMTDVLMPCMNGVEMSRKIQEMCYKTPIIISAGSKRERYHKELKYIRVAEYIRKPVQIKEAYEALNDCCNKIQQGKRIPELKE